ncbi:MAG: UDP-2,4-diacetamido-2,4,6-trideoxy-beta-L-altropyranose hydrolase [Nitrospinota bacterium]|nr:UDP-2,4-diacetamido-2,4,6-trideoxy-beta-L-altropyranose hydrolase [Nitrospinota bacterium]
MSKKKNEKRVLIRADGSKKVGFGHLVRTANLAQELIKAGWVVKFFTLMEENDKSPANFFELRNLKYRKELKTIHDPAKVHLEEMKHFNCSITILDSYSVDDSYRHYLKKAGVTIIAVDDVYKHYSHSDIVLNHNPSADTSRYGDYRGKMLVGPTYSLISPRFSNIKRKLPSWLSPPNILVTMGGSDATDQRTRVVRILESMTEKFNITVVGGFYSARSETGKKGSGVKHKIEFIGKSDDFPAVVEKSDAAITAGGITTMELASAGIPFIVLLTDSFQLDNAKEWEKLGAGIYGGDTSKLSDEELREVFSRFIALNRKWVTMGLSGREIFDGKGAERAAQKITEFLS